MNIVIDDTKLEGFTQGAKDEMSKQILTFANEVVEEANRIESNYSENGDEPEIITAYIREAARSRMRFKNKKSLKNIVVHILSSISILFAGLLYDTDEFKSALWKLLIFIGILLIAGVSTTLVYVWEEQK